MATALDTVTRAMRLARILSHEEPGEDAEVQDALTVMNDMLHGWAKEGVDFGHITMVLTDTHRTHDSYLEGIRYNLAVRLAEEYGKPILGYVEKRARESFAAFQAHTLEFTDYSDMDPALDPRYFGNRGYGGYNIDKS